MLKIAIDLRVCKFGVISKRRSNKGVDVLPNGLEDRLNAHAVNGINKIRTIICSNNNYMLPLTPVFLAWTTVGNWKKCFEKYHIGFHRKKCC